jgi:hypothetical protein
MKIKNEFLKHSVYLNGVRRYFIDMNEKELKWYFERGFQWIFEVIEEEVIEEDNFFTKIEEDNDTNK